jgi:multidrug resistance efflux pump
VALALDEYRRLKRLAEKGLVSNSQLAEAKAHYDEARQADQQTSLEQQVQSQLLRLDVEAASVKLDVARKQWEGKKEAYQRGEGVTGAEVDAQRLQVELARIELERAQLKLKLHEDRAALAGEFLAGEAIPPAK